MSCVLSTTHIYSVYCHRGGEKPEIITFKGRICSFVEEIQTQDFNMFSINEVIYKLRFLLFRKWINKLFLQDFFHHWSEADRVMLLSTNQRDFRLYHFPLLWNRCLMLSRRQNKITLGNNKWKRLTVVVVSLLSSQRRMNLDDERDRGSALERQCKQGHAWLPPQIVQSRPAIQLLPAKAPDSHSVSCISAWQMLENKECNLFNNTILFFYIFILIHWVCLFSTTVFKHCIY